MSPQYQNQGLYESGIIGQHKETTRNTGLQNSHGHRPQAVTANTGHRESRSANRSDGSGSRVKSARSNHNSDLQGAMNFESTHPVYSQNQLKNFSNALSSNSSSVVVHNHVANHTLVLAMGNNSLIKHKVYKKKQNLQKSKKRMDKVKNYGKGITEQYQKDKAKHRKQKVAMSSVSRRLSRKNNADSLSRRHNDLPHGLRRHLQNISVEKQNETISGSKPNSKASPLEKSSKMHIKQTKKTKIVDNRKKRVVPTSSESLQKNLKIEDKLKSKHHHPLTTLYRHEIHEPKVSRRSRSPPS